MGVEVGVRGYGKPYSTTLRCSVLLYAPTPRSAPVVIRRGGLVIFRRAPSRGAIPLSVWSRLGFKLPERQESSGSR
jgi:hypothetical protein